MSRVLQATGWVRPGERPDRLQPGRVPARYRGGGQRWPRSSAVVRVTEPRRHRLAGNPQGLVKRRTEVGRAVDGILLSLGTSGWPRVGVLRMWRVWPTGAVGGRPPLQERPRLPPLNAPPPPRRGDVALPLLAAAGHHPLTV